jgi:exosortase
VWRELTRRPDLAVNGSAWGFLILVPALALHAIDAGLHTELLSAVALIAAFPGLSLVCIGIAGTKRILLPLAFLSFALPIPLALTENLHLALRHVAANAAAALLPLAGMTVFLEGTTLHTTRGALQVSDACSGFSTLYAAMAVACLVAYTANGWRRKLAVIVAAAPIAIAANVARVVLLVALVIWRGADLLGTVIHPASGIMTFAVALPIIFWLGGSARARGAA